jgi:hypothetical protein
VGSRRRVRDYLGMLAVAFVVLLAGVYYWVGA